MHTHTYMRANVQTYTESQVVIPDFLQTAKALLRSLKLGLLSLNLGLQALLVLET